MELRRELFRRTLGQRLPRTSGDLLIAGPHDALRIQRDDYGVAYVEATNDHDAWFGLGFCQGQDRSFQLELRLRTVRGTLSALIGAQGLSIDRLSRRLGFRHASQQQIEVIAPDIRAHLEAFVAGINAGINHGTPLAHEFSLMRAWPSTWDLADVLGVGKLMSFLLVGNWDVELARLKILELDGEQALRDLDPVYPAHLPVSAPPGHLAGAALDRLSADLALFLDTNGHGGGSNNWALSGNRTASGRPILANDPHLDPALPAHWYLARLRTPEWSVAGASLIGSPAFGAAHNGFCAWGITAGLADTSDLFIEELGPDGRSVRSPQGSFEPCLIRDEIIDVKGGEPVTEQVLVTPRGPIISPALRDIPQAISLRAVWLQPLPARGFLDIHKARSPRQFRESFAQWPLLSQNVAYADVDGNIAWMLVGEVPRRDRGFGVLPLPAHLGTAWQDLIPLAEMPQALNPKGGVVASANNKPTSDSDGPYLGVDWLDGYRLSAIMSGLSQRSAWDVASTMALQLDVVSQPWLEVRDLVLGLDASSENAARALAMLRAWDGDVSASSAAATVFELFIARVWRRVAEARAPRSSQWVRGQGFATLMPITTFAAGRGSRILRLIREQPDGWLPRPWPQELAAALSDTVAELRAEQGDAPADWQWGKLRQLTLDHPVGGIPQLAWLFNRGPFSVGGDGNTISQAGINPFRPLGNPLAIASLRAVIDVGDWDNARFVMPGGQSGNPLSPHYDDQVPLWLAGAGIPIAWTDDATSRAIRQTLRLKPLTSMKPPAESESRN